MNEDKQSSVINFLVDYILAKVYGKNLPRFKDYLISAEDMLSFNNLYSLEESPERLSSSIRKIKKFLKILENSQLYEQCARIYKALQVLEEVEYEKKKS